MARRGRGGDGIPLAGRLGLAAGGGALLACLLVGVMAGRGLDPKLLLLLGLALAGAVAALAWREGTALSRRLTELALATGKLARGDFNVRFRAGGSKEAGRLRRQLEDLAANLREGVVEEQLAKIREKEARLLGRLRQRMMPERLPAPAGWEAEGLFLPGRRGGGDFLDGVAAGGRLFLAAGSAQGAGAAAGMVMVLGRTLLREWLGRGERPPQVLNRLNQELREQLVEGACLTLTLVELDPAAEGEVAVWGAGLQGPLYFFGRGEAMPVALEGIALGLDKGPVFASALQPRRVRLVQGQRLVLANPGLCGNLSPEGEEYGETRLADAIRRHGAKNTGAFLDLLAGEVEGFLGGEEPDEDLVVVTLKRVV